MLVVEDNPVNRKVAVRLLQQLGLAADAVPSGVEALDALERIPYDLVLMDCQMPGMDGFETSLEIRRREGTSRHTPIVALTANGDPERCFVAGMDDYLGKPVAEEDLARVLDRWLPSARAVDEATIAHLRDIGGGDEFVREVAALYVQDSRARLDAIRSAVASGNAVALAEAAHALKSSSGNIGATRVEELAEELEHTGQDGAMDGVAGLVDRLVREYETVEKELKKLR